MLILRDFFKVDSTWGKVTSFFTSPCNPLITRKCTKISRALKRRSARNQQNLEFFYYFSHGGFLWVYTEYQCWPASSQSTIRRIQPYHSSKSPSDYRRFFTVGFSENLGFTVGFFWIFSKIKFPFFSRAKILTFPTSNCEILISDLLSDRSEMEHES